MMIDASIITEFERNGYAILSNILTVEVVEALRQIWSERYIPQHQRSFIVGNEVGYEYPGLVFPIVAGEGILDILEALMGPQVQLDSIAITGVPGNDGSSISWHRDPYARLPRGTAYYYPNSVHLLVYLQDMDTNTGPLRVLPGSHRRPRCISEETRHLPQGGERLIAVNSGDGVLIHNQLLHSRSPNRSTDPRLLFSAIYTLSCMKSTIDYYHPTVAALLQELTSIGDSRLMRLMGLDDSFDQKYNCGFLSPEKELWKLWAAA
ncbi:hypothetical protein CN223_30500 [Sinorhizobium meliloti]|nr:hypothetical protein CN223_30500 [Sinorhizobium meliloti]